jgi:uncharacterized membrane protein YhiD involved in acid resistance
MGRSQTFQDFLTGNAPQISAGTFLIDLLLAGVLSFLLGLFYVHFGRALSNRTTLGRNFVMIGMTTMVIISVVKSSLALSLGLVGALSIVRFRTAIKEPEELAYLFLTIAIGLGLGAGQRLITLLAFVIILAVLWLRSLKRESEGNKNLFLTVASEGNRKIQLDEIVKLLEPHCRQLRLKRFDESNGSVEALFEVDFDDYERLERATHDLRERNGSVRLSFLQTDGI